jgi:predicted site-specific integrase-resolvase
MHTFDDLVAEHTPLLEEGEKFYTEKEAAELIPPKGVSVWTMKSWVRKGLIVPHRIGGRVYVARSELQRFLRDAYGRPDTTYFRKARR